MTNPTLDEKASEYRKNFKWQGVVNRLRTHNYAAYLGFKSGYETAVSEFVDMLEKATDPSSYKWSEDAAFTSDDLMNEGAIWFSRQLLQRLKAVKVNG